MPQGHTDLWLRDLTSVFEVDQILFFINEILNHRFSIQFPLSYLTQFNHTYNFSKMRLIGQETKIYDSFKVSI